MRIATYNVEWFTNLFDSTDRLLMDDGWSGRQDVTRAQQIESLGIVFTAVDADAWMIIEAPDENGKHSTVAQLENFADAFGRRNSHDHESRSRRSAASETRDGGRADP